MKATLCKTLLWAAVVGTAWVGSVRAQETGAVRGIVYDSIMSAPLADAAVFLWRTPHRATTDSTGRFTIPGVPPGDYSLVFFHTRLGEMGISQGPRNISVDAGGTTEVRLATPSMFTVVVSQCLLEGQEPRSGTLAGWVGDAETGTGMPGARITLSWIPPGGKEVSYMTLTADARGWYRTCEAPTGIPISASARFMSLGGLRREVTVAEGMSRELGFHMDRLSPAAISGHLVDAESGASVAEAEVWLRGTGFRGLTDPDGHFSFRDVPPGAYMLMTDHIRYGTKMDTLSVPSGQNISVEMRVDTRPIEMAPLTVTVDAQPLTERAMGGLTIDRAAIDKVRGVSRDVGDILRAQHLPGLLIRRRQDGTVCVGSSQGQVRMMGDSNCVSMVIFIDNVRVSNPHMALQLPPDAIDHIVIYKPVEAGNLFGLGSGNGVLAIFTRSR